ncbi:hypothetical protein pb186bvf_008095 [Paramecium bursaria]
MSNPFTPFEITKQMIEYRRNSFFQQSLKTEFTFQQENKYRNKITSVSSQLKNINSIERKITCGDGNSASESSGESSCCEEQLTKLSIDQVVDMVIDTKVYVISTPDPVPSQKGQRVDSEWENQNRIILINVDEQENPECLLKRAVLIIYFICGLRTSPSSCLSQSNWLAIKES